MTLDVRPINDSQIGDWIAAVGRGFLQHRPILESDIETRRAVMDLNRTLAGFDSDTMVSTLRSFATELTVPGGASVPASAVTGVTTTSTYRRRGLATQMVTHDLRTAAERGEQVAVLIAAEWGIYGRFGYGASTEHQTLTLNTRGTQLRSAPRGSVEFVDRDTARILAPQIYEQHRTKQSGQLNWMPWAWDVDYGIVRFGGVAESPSFHAIARDERGEPIGFARYQFKEEWEQRQAAGKITIEAMIGSTVQGEALMWKHLLDHDLATSVVAADRSAADVLPLLLTDPRHVSASERADFLWLRVLDPAGLLAQRRYATRDRLVIEIIDPLGLAHGRFLLTSDDDGATCTPTDTSADLTMPVSTLASLYLGGHHVRARLLAAVGLIDEHTAGAVARADAMFASEVTPWSSTWF